jgi:phage N-6-adenine-methyltransferase
MSDIVRHDGLTAVHLSLTECEAEMEQCRGNIQRDFRRFGYLLDWVLTEKLYLQRDPTLTKDAYCLQKWEFGYTRAHQIIQASRARAVEISSTAVDEISTERQVRNLLQEARRERVEGESDRDWNRVMFNGSDDDIGDKKCSGEWDNEDEEETAEDIYDEDSPEYQFGHAYAAAAAAQRDGYDVALPDPVSYGLPTTTEVETLDLQRWSADDPYRCDFRVTVPEDSGEASKPHVAHNSGNNEWYTPVEYVDAAFKVMGAIDLDPASSATANEVIDAATFYTADDDGLSKDWHGRVWMNPPYASDLIGKFAAKLCQHFNLGEVTEAVVLVNNATETGWFQEMAALASAICFPRGRVKFWHPEKESAPLQGQAVIYLGSQPKVFQSTFANFGFVAVL